MSTPDQSNPRKFTSMGQHPLGVRLLGVQHMCPECGDSAAREWCPVCVGQGMISAERLDRWERAQWTATGAGLPVVRRIKAQPL
jgi:ribosomal protein S27AE